VFLKVPSFAPVLYNLYINDAPSPPGTYLSQFVDNTSVYMTERHERRVVLKLQRGFTAVKCERWNVKINEGKT
jgi:hypothetical protein